MKKIAVLKLNHASIKNAGKANAMQNVENYNIRTKAALYGRAQGAVTGKLAKFKENIRGPTI